MTGHANAISARRAPFTYVGGKCDDASATYLDLRPAAERIGRERCGSCQWQSRRRPGPGRTCCALRSASGMPPWRPRDLRGTAHGDGVGCPSVAPRRLRRAVRQRRGPVSLRQARRLRAALQSAPASDAAGQVRSVSRPAGRRGALLRARIALGVGVVALMIAKPGAQGSTRARAWAAVVVRVLVSLGAVLRGRRPMPTLRPRGGRLGLPADFLVASDGRVFASRYRRSRVRPVVRGRPARAGDGRCRRAPVHRVARRPRRAHAGRRRTVSAAPRPSPLSWTTAIGRSTRRSRATRVRSSSARCSGARRVPCGERG